MPSSQLRTYDPQANDKYVAHHNRLSALWAQAVREQRETGRIQPETKAAYVDVVKQMRSVRLRQYSTTAQVARRMFNILVTRAALSSVRLPEMPDLAAFTDLRAVREFYCSEMDNIRRQRKERETRKRELKLLDLPIAPEDAPDMPFASANRPGLVTQALFIPDVDGGFPLVATYEKDDRDILHVCLEGRSPPGRFRAHVAQLATLMMERMFAADDRNRVVFYLHLPAPPEQFLVCDLKTDTRGRFHMSGVRPMQMLPHGLAHKRFADGLPPAETQALVLDQYAPYALFVEMSVRRQEDISVRHQRVQKWRQGKIRM